MRKTNGERERERKRERERGRERERERDSGEYVLVTRNDDDDDEQIIGNLLSHLFEVVFSQNIFTEELNIVLPLKKTGHRVGADEISSSWCGGRKEKFITTVSRDMIGPRTINSLEKGATVNNVSYCQQFHFIY